MMATVQQANAVRTDQGSPVLFAGVKDALFQKCTFVRLLTKTCRDNHESPDTLLTTEIIDIVGTILGSHHKHCQVCLWQVLYIVTGLDALHLVFFRVDDTKFTFESAVDDVPHNGTTRLMYIVGAAYYDDTPWVEQLFVYHRCKDSANRIKYQIYLDIFEKQLIFE